MTVYHGTTDTITMPDVSYSKLYLDFGPGFYVTTYQKQAEKWALRKSLRSNKPAIVNLYEMSQDFEGLQVLRFDADDEDWLDFVCSCRKGEMLHNRYDLIIGNVANDDVFKTVDMYFRGLWDKEKALEEIRYYKLNDQLCFGTQRAIEKLLTYKDSYVVR